MAHYFSSKLCVLPMSLCSYVVKCRLQAFASLITNFTDTLNCHIPMKTILSTSLILLIAFTVSGQDVYQGQRQSWLQKAEQMKPQLTETTKKPISIVSLVKDTAAFQDWKAANIAPLDSLYNTSFKTKSGIVVDFGEHLTGYYTFTVKARRGTPDAPLRFRFKFGEVPSEVATPFDPYTGSLSRAWLQDEIVDVMELPATITIPRRLAFRYVQIDLLGSSPYYDFSITNMQCKATTSVTN